MKFDKRVCGNTRVLGIIGNPVRHTISPLIHNSISSEIGEKLIYVPFEVKEQDLKHAISGIKALGILGCNVTVPYKSEVIRFIDNVSDEARIMGAVNTIKNNEGVLYGYNTDGDGFLESFIKESGTDFLQKKVLMFGAGGSARSMSVKIALNGAKIIRIVNRTMEKAQNIKEIIENNSACVVEIYENSQQVVQDIINDSDIVINTTSLGMNPKIENSPLDESVKFSSSLIFYDAIYTPARTKFLKSAKENDCVAINGFGMLFYQAVKAYKIWTNKRLEDESLNLLYNQLKEMTIK